MRKNAVGKAREATARGRPVDAFDLASSAAVVLASLLFAGIDLSPLSNPEAGGFSASFAKLALGFFAMYAIGEASSGLYSAFRKGSGGGVRVRFVGDALKSGAVELGSVIAIGTFYAVYKNLSFPYASVILTAVNGLALGFSVGVELRLEAGAFVRGGSGRARELFDHALKNNLPFGALALLAFFPADWLIERSEASIPAKAAMVAICLAGYVLAGARLSDLPWARIEIKPRNGPATNLVVAALAFGAMLGYRYWDESAAEGIRQADGPPASSVAMLFFSGLVPIRLIPLLASRGNIVNVLSNLASLALYLCLKIL